MPVDIHYKAIRCLEKRIDELNKEIKIVSKIMDEPEMLADYHFAKADKENFQSEIHQLKNTITHLIN